MTIFKGSFTAIARASGRAPFLPKTMRVAICPPTL
jgi:hypothetical protein